MLERAKQRGDAYDAFALTAEWDRDIATTREQLRGDPVLAIFAGRRGSDLQQDMQTRHEGGQDAVEGLHGLSKSFRLARGQRVRLQQVEQKLCVATCGILLHDGDERICGIGATTGSGYEDIIGRVIA